MAGAGLTLSYTDTPVRDAVMRLQTFGGERQHSLLDAIGAYGENSTRMRFRTGQAPDGSSWKPSKRVLRKGGQTLVLTGRLRNSLTHNVLAGNTGVEWGTNVKYGRIHQTGGTIHIYARGQSVFHRLDRDGAISPRFVTRKTATFERHVVIGEHEITIPARPYLGINAQDKQELEGISQRHLQAALLGTTPGSIP